MKVSDYVDPKGCLLWCWVAVLAAVSATLLSPIFSDSLAPQILHFPGFQNVESLAHAQALRHLIIWIFAALVLIFSLGFASAIAVAALANCAAFLGAARIIGVVVFASLAYVVYRWPASAVSEGLQTEFVQLLGAVPWLGIEQIEIGARRLAVIGTLASVHVLLALLAFSIVRPRGRGQLEVLAELGMRLARIRILIYLTGVGLAAGVIATGSLLSMHISPELEGQSLVAAKSYVRTSTLAYGGIYSLLLLVSVLPSTLHLTRSIRRNTLEVLPGSTVSEQQKFMQENDLQSPISSQAWQWLAVLLPAITSIVGEPVVSAIGALVL